jgi:hypothetical protein
MRRNFRNFELEARRDALEREATALLRADARRMAARQPKLKPKAPAPPLMPMTGWMPLASLQRALRQRNSGNGRTGN